jgi:hypothetical protein
MRTISERDVSTSADTARPLRRRRWLHRTGDRLRLVLTVTMGAGLLAGVGGGLEIMAQGRALDEIAARHGPLTTAAAELYRALADADATSAVAYLGRSLESADLRDRYLRDIAAANAALSTAAAGSPTPESAGIIAGLANHMPTYTGLIETARTNNRQDLLVGTAYLRQASELLRDRMLPAAQRLHRTATDQLAAAQAEAARWPLVGLLLSGVLVLWLLAVQVYLWRLTRRLLNIGLLVASLLALTAGAWLGIAGGIAARHSDDSRQDGSRQLEILAEARIQAVLALGSEALSVIARDSGAGSDPLPPNLITLLTDQDDGLLAQARAAIRQADSTSEITKAAGIARQWLAVHENLTGLDEGNYSEAATIVAGPDQDSAANLAATYDEHIATAAARATERFDAGVRAAREALPGAGVGLMVLGGLVVLAAAAGMAPRIREYR